MADKISLKESIDRALEIYKDISRQIQFADTKAGLILAWHAASLGFLSKLVIDHLTELNRLSIYSFSCAIIVALISIWFSFWVVYPRLKDTSCVEECMFWIYHIRCKKDFKEDLERFKENILDEKKIFECISRSVVAISEVLKTKYRYLKYSLISLGIALLFEIFTLFTLFFA